MCNLCYFIAKIPLNHINNKLYDLESTKSNIQNSSENKTYIASAVAVSVIKKYVCETVVRWLGCCGITLPNEELISYDVSDVKSISKLDVSPTPEMKVYIKELIAVQNYEVKNEHEITVSGRTSNKRGAVNQLGFPKISRGMNLNVVYPSDTTTKYISNLEHYEEALITGEKLVVHSHTKNFVFSQNGQADDEEINENSMQKKQHIAKKKKAVATVRLPGNNYFT